jgi:membrane-bound lytic murein transglycosylase MltF
MGYEAIFQRVAAEFDLNWYLLMEQAYSESLLDSNAVGPNDELGLMKISQAIWGEWAPRVGATEPHDPESNLRVASAYLDWIHTRLARVGRPEWYWTMAAYNWGIWDLLWLVEAGGLWRHVPAEHQQYATTIVVAAEADALAAQIQAPTNLVYG